LSACACDSGLRIVGLELVTYPDKLLYVVGIDSELNLEGGTIAIVTKDDEKNGNRFPEPMDTLGINVKHDIDFTKEGIYVVHFERAGYGVSFPVQVLSVESIERMLDLRVRT
jgi:hypothetical protein